MGDSPHPGAKPRDDSGHLLPHLPLPPHPHSGPASPPTPIRHNGWFVLRPQDACSPLPLLRLCSVTWGRCTRLWPRKGAVLHPLHRHHWRQPPLSLPPAAGNLGAQGQGACGHLLGVGWVPFLTEFVSLPNNPGGSLWSFLIPSPWRPGDRKGRALAQGHTASRSATQVCMFFLFL